MQFTNEKVPADAKGLTSFFIRLQRALAQAFGNIPWSTAQHLDVGFYPTELPLKLANKLGAPASGVILVSLQAQTGANPTAGVFVDWINEGDFVKIVNVTGLTSTQYYNASFFIYA